MIKYLIVNYHYLLRDSNVNAEDISVRSGHWDIKSSNSNEFELRGHSTTTWTKFCIFYPAPLHGQFLYLGRGQKTDIFWLPPHSSCLRSYWMSPNRISRSIRKININSSPIFREHKIVQWCCINPFDRRIWAKGGLISEGFSLLAQISRKMCHI